jgi:hypothetical protein
MSSDTDSNDKARSWPVRWVAAAVLTLSAACAVGLWALQSARAVKHLPPAIRLTPPPKSVEDALAPVSGATGVIREGGAYESFFVSYTVKRAYPAKDVIDEIGSRLNKLGWRPLKDDWLNPGSPTSHVRGWSEYFDSTRGPPLHVDTWNAEWENDAGEIVLYSFDYSYPTSGTLVRDTLAVNAGWYPASGRAEMQHFARSARSKGSKSWWRKWADWLRDLIGP